MAKKVETKVEQKNPVAGRIKDLPVFSIPAGDPYIDAVIRCYYKQEKARKDKAQANTRPFILEADDLASNVALDNYIQRASGACDNERLIEAEKAAAAFGEYAKK